MFKDYLTYTSFLLYFLRIQSGDSLEMFYVMVKASEIMTKAIFSGRILTEEEMKEAMMKAIEEDFPN